MIRVKLVIIRTSDGSTVSRLIRIRICSDSESGRPSPETWFIARLSAPDAAAGPAGGAAAGAACAKAGSISRRAAHKTTARIRKHLNPLDTGNPKPSANTSEAPGDLR